MPTYRPTHRPTFRQHGIGLSENQPMSQLNITPLIDVLLVLLVMLMLSIPIATHKVEVTLPPPIPGSGEPPEINLLRINNAGVTLWNGEAVTEPELKTLLTAMAKDPDLPQLHMQTDANARYEIFDHTIATVKRSGVQAIGFIGNSQFEKWDSGLN
ncbi:ExbD/TolR family protein [Parasphingorhabdus cellanae]|uniref:Biopolymer transporter ExbD n=1 Tax=Parasphingorhabdus cellanae TaxID=2806553 RepID=A0ABX7T2H4_9SPHN|nr:biopolymer transporter ExbD [Parasphingorhabdus cellanae]QTD55750.1 biopolymer transporter ExbD [Parasphingorhabdus cellanae]